MGLPQDEFGETVAMTTGGVAAVDHAASRAGSAPTSPVSRERAARAVAATLATAVAGALALAALAVGSGFLLARELVHGVVGRWDTDVATWLVAHRTAPRNDVSRIGSALAETATVVVVVALVLVFLALRRHWQELGVLAIAIAVEGVTYAVATYLVTRHRPRVPRLEDLIVSDSFFSGHTAASVAVYGSLAVVVWRLTRRRWARGLVLAVVVLVPVVVGLSRMYRGMHYASDAVAGALVGLGCIVVALVAVREGKRFSVVPEARRDDLVVEPSHGSPVGVAS